MKSNIRFLFFSIALFIVLPALPVNAASGDTVIRSFDQEKDYNAYAVYTVFPEDDLTFVIENIANLSLYGCTEKTFTASADKCIELKSDWYIEGQDPAATDYSNIHFELHPDAPGRYELTGRLIFPEGYSPEENLELPVLHVIVNILAPGEKLEITNFNVTESIDLITAPEIVSLHDPNGLYLLFLPDMWAGTTADNTQAALLDMTWDLSTVDIDQEGTYEVPLVLSVLPEFADRFYISDDNSHYTKTLHVADPKKWKFFVTLIYDDRLLIELSRIPNPWRNLELYLLESSTPLEDSALFYDAFSPCPDNGMYSVEMGSFSICRDFLEPNRYYYFYFKTEGEFSNIIGIMDDGTHMVYISTEGNRDGGDSTEPSDDPQVEQPAPPAAVVPPGDTTSESPSEGTSQKSETLADGTKPSTSSDEPSRRSDPADDIPSSASDSSDNDTSTNPPSHNAAASGVPKNTHDNPTEESAVSSRNTTSGQTEKVTAGRTEITGARLSYLYEIYGEYIPFSGSGITVKIPSAYLKSRNIGEEDILAVEITKDAPFAFRIRIFINDAEIIPDSPLQIMAALDGHPMPDTLYIDGKITDTKLTEANGYVCFEAAQTGYLELKSQIPSESSKSVFKRKTLFPAFLLIITVLLASCILLFKNKRGKNNHART